MKITLHVNPDRMDEMDEYAQGWIAADDALRDGDCYGLDYSQGTSEWDRGWNDRLAQEGW